MFWRVSDLSVSAAFALAKAALIAMVLLIVVDVVLRYAVRTPVPGAYEMVGFLSAAAVAFSLGHIQRIRGHIAVATVTEALPQRYRGVLRRVTLALEGVFFGLVAVQFVSAGGNIREASQVSDILEIPIFIIYYAMAAGAILVLPVVVRQLLQSEGEMAHES